jgi:hypothetical protein
MTASRLIAMWSGPRNISTAMMRSWGNRDDTFVVDEPLYAHYLLATGRPHPGAQEVIAHYDTDWRKVVALLTGPVPEGKSIFFQKHMTHHLLPDMDRGWLLQLTNCFLTRHPREVLASYLEVEGAPEPRLEDLGLEQQVDIFELVRRQTGTLPAVVDAADVVADPRRILGLLCETLRLPFTDRMLSWPAGPRETDGIWAKHWYASVEKSTSFEARPHKPRPIPSRLMPLYEQCEDFYHQLHEHRLR